jgi:NAD(P)-dependent dehydrogenase (short-subunit alcohol dehydrogenase family)
MERRVAIVTGRLRGPGRAMALVSCEGHSVLAVGHIDADVEHRVGDTGANFPGRILPLVADLRQPGECDRIVATAAQGGWAPQILVNNAG